MSRDTWERLVAAVIKREQIWQLCHTHSRSPSISSDTSSYFSGPILDLEASVSVPPPSPVVLTDPSVYLEDINEAVKEAGIFRLECSEIGMKVEHLCHMLQSINDIAMSSATFYARPFHRISVEVLRNLKKSYTFVKKCRLTPLRRIIFIHSLTPFRKLLNLLESSVADMTWVLSIYEAGSAGGGITLPPIASNDPMISWVWSFISSLYMGQLHDKIESANELASLAKDNDRNKQIIVEEGGILPLLKLLKDSSSSEGQIAAASALYNLVNDTEGVRSIIDELGVPISVQVLGDSPMKVQIKVANLVAKMAEYCPLAQEDFARDNVIRPLVTLLTFDLLMDNSKLKVGKQSIHSLVQINKEITAAAESNADLRWATFKINSPAAKAVVDQLLRVMKDFDDPRLRIASIRAIGSLARAFPARETRVIGLLVGQLNHRNQDVAIEAAISLGKFACPENFLCVEHSKTIIEFRGVPPLMRLLRGNEKAQLHGLVLICYLAIHAGKSDDL